MMEQPKKMALLKNAGAELEKIIGPTDIHDFSIRQWVLQGKVKSVHAGRRVLVNMDSLVSFLENGESSEPDEPTGIRRIPEKFRA